MSAYTEYAAELEALKAEYAAYAAEGATSEELEFFIELESLPVVAVTGGEPTLGAILRASARRSALEG